MSVQLAAGAELAGYRIVRVLGRGGMGVVYLAEDERLYRPVALKVVKEELADDSRFRERFLRESELAAGLDHPSVVPVYGAGEANGVLYLAMRYVAGSDLRAVLRDEQPVPADRALRILEQVAGALDAAHAAGLVHRDVKPANILLTGDPKRRGEHAYLADFGLAKRPATADSATGSAILGTLAYAAPEQIEGAAVDGRADIYSLGCLLYECLTGTPPYRADSDLGVVYAHLQQPPPRVSEASPGLPAALDPVISRALAKRPTDRYDSATDLLDAARTALPELLASPARPRAPIIIAAALAAVGVTALGAATIYGRPHDTAAPAPVAAGAPSGRSVIVAIDGRSGRIIARTPLADGAVPNDIVATDGSIWVADSTNGTVTQIDPLTHRIVRAFGVPGIQRLATGDGVLWAMTLDERGSEAFRLIDERAGRLTRSVKLPRRPDGPVAVGGGAAWLVRIRDDGTDELTRIATDGSDRTESVRTGRDTALGPVTYAAGGPLFVAARRPDGMTEVVLRRGSTGRVTVVTQMLHRGHAYDPGTEAIATSPAAIWVLAADGTVWQVDPTTSAVAGSVALGPGAWTSLAAGRQGAWAANAANGTVVQADTAAGGGSPPITVGGTPSAIAADGDMVDVAVMPTPPDPVPQTAPPPGTLRVVGNADADTYDGSSYSALAWQLEFITCDALLDYAATADPGRQAQLVPGVATSLPAVSSDGRVYTFHIQRGLVFNDGTRLTAADVRDTYLRNLSPEASFDALTNGYYDAIVGLDAYRAGRAKTISGIQVDGDTISFHLTHRDGAFPYATAMRWMCIVPRGTARAHSLIPPPMTGPFQIVSRDPGRSLVLEPNRYWPVNAKILGSHGPAGVRRIEVVFGLTEAQQVAAIEDGNADLTYSDPRTMTTRIRLQAYALLRTNGSLALSPQGALNFIEFDTTSGPFRHVDLRRAANFAVDREAIARIPAMISQNPWSRYLPSPQVAAGSPAPYPDHANLAEARRLIARSGVRPPINVQLWYTSAEGRDNEAVVGAIARQLDVVGFHVTLRLAWASSYFSELGSANVPFNMSYQGYAQDFPDPAAVLPPTLGTGAIYNYGRFSSKDVDRRMARLATLPIGLSRRRGWSELARDVAERDAPLLVITDLDWARLHSDRVHDVIVTPEKGTDFARLRLSG